MAIAFLGLTAVVEPAEAAVESIDGDYRGGHVRFTVRFTEASSYYDGWEFQLFIDADDDAATGYSDGFDLLVRGVELAAPGELHLRWTGGGDGAGGWGATVATVPFVVIDARNLTFDVPLAPEAGLSDGNFRFDFESYYDGVIRSWVRDGYTESSRCYHDADCDDGQFCNGEEFCDDGVCQAGTDPCPGIPCDEAVDRCDPCTDDDECDDGFFCNGAEYCDEGVCRAGAEPCPDVPCDEAADECDTCVDDDDCDDGVFCNGAEYCEDRLCHAGPDPCPGALCDEAYDECAACFDDADCDDGLFCNGAERCANGSCQPGPDPCPDLTCDEAADRCATPVDCVTSTDRWQNVDLEPQSDVFSILFSATPHGGRVDALTGLSSGEAHAFGDSALTARFNIDGHIDAFDPEEPTPWDPGTLGWYRAMTHVPYTAGTVYHFRIVVDLPANTYDVYVTPDGGAEQTIAEGFAFREQAGDVAVLDHWHTWAGTGSHDVCDVRLAECDRAEECDDGLFCNGIEQCERGACRSGPDPCPGMGCSELLDQCTVMFDSDYDGDIDLDDFVDFSGCLTGEGVTARPRCRAVHDRDGDGDVDLLDYAEFQVAFDPPPPPPLFADWTGDGQVSLEDYAALTGCLSGPGRLAPPECRTFDADHDRDVDTLDFGQVQMAIAGAPVSWGADWDYSGFIDLADYRIFAICLHGPDTLELPACDPFDVNHDAHVDLEDYAAIQRAFVPPRRPNEGSRFVDVGELVRCAACMTGPNQPASGECRPFDMDGDADIDLADWQRWAIRLHE